MIQIQTIGYVGNDATAATYEDKKVVNFSIAHTEKIKQKNGAEIELTQWVNCSYWTTAKIEEHIKKGSCLFIQGELRVSLYDMPSGDKNFRLDCRVTKIEFISSKKST
jgi:single-strand DNA-binding protein